MNVYWTHLGVLCWAVLVAVFAAQLQVSDTKMIKRAILPVSLLIILLATNFLWFGKYIDSSLTIDSLNGDIFYKERAITDLKSLFLFISTDTSKEELKNILKSKLKNPDIFEKDGNVYYQNFGFIFENDQLKRVITEVSFNPDSKG